MTTWYKLSNWKGYKDVSYISPVEVERETDSCIYIGGSRQAKSSNYNSYYRTWAEAKEALVARALRKHENAQDAFDRACRELLEAEAEREPQT